MPVMNRLMERFTFRPKAVAELGVRSRDFQLSGIGMGRVSINLS